MVVSILRRDLSLIILVWKYDKERDCLVGDPSATRDPVLKRGSERFDEYVKNIYRVLMSRGLKECYVYFVDKGTENYFRSRMV